MGFFTLSVAVHVSPQSLRFAKLEGTKPTLVDLPTLIFPVLHAAFLFPIPCNFFILIINNKIPSISTLVIGLDYLKRKKSREDQRRDAVWKDLERSHQASC